MFAHFCHLRKFTVYYGVITFRNRNLRSLRTVAVNRRMHLSGYADDHSGDIYRFYNMRTGKIVLSRDVIWVNKTYQENKMQPVGLEQFYNDHEEDEDIMPMRVKPAPVNAPVNIPSQPRWVDRLHDELTEVYEQ